jgi:DNA repair exonuclease SbcCD ATPase subunit
MTESQSFTASSAISLGSAVNDNNLQSQLAILDRQRQILVNTRANAAQGVDAGDETNENQVGSESASASSILKRAKAAEAKVDMLKRQLIQALQANNAGGSPGAVGESASEPQVDAAGAAIGAAGAKGKVAAPTRGRGGGGADPAEVRKMQRQIKELETRLQAAESGGGIDKKAAAAAEKAQAKKLKDLENSFRKEKAALESRAIKAEGALEAAAASLPLITEERDALRAKVKELSDLVMEMGTLREQAGRAVELAQNLKDKEGELVVLQEQFKKETFLRKKYKNELEDLKGNIRVYARCRPFAQYELDRKCAACVTFPDDSTVKVVTSRGEKVFEFDTAFTPTSTQTEVFEDTKRLVESCIDGYNVCLFAYGQTGVCRSIYFVCV